MIKEFLGRIFYIMPALPKTVQIGITNVCNFNCAMCQRFDLDVTLKHIKMDTFRRILERIDGAESIILTGWGEPLTHPNLIEMIKLCKEKRFDVRFTTNGSLFTENLINELLEAKVNAVTFSVDSIDERDSFLGHPVIEQHKNIIKLKKRVRETNSNTKIYLQAVYCKAGDEDMLKIADFAVKNGVDRLRVSRLDVRFHDFPRPSWQDEKKLINILKKKLKGTTVGIDFLPHTAFDGLRRIFYKLTYRLLHRCGRYCLRTYNDIYINEDGEVTPCCALPKLSMGNLLAQELAEIWLGEKFKEFRKNQKLICGKCDVLALKIHD